MPRLDPLGARGRSPNDRSERRSGGSLLRILKQGYRKGLHAAIRVVNAMGFAVAPVADYYSPLPSRGQLVKSWERWNRPSELVGLSPDVEAMSRRLAELSGRFGAELADLPPYEECKRRGYGPGFTRADAQILYCMLRSLGCRRYVEIGSGLSTFISSCALARNRDEGRPARMTCIDPHPRSEVGRIPDLEVVARQVQDLDPAYFADLGAGDVLFIDSTHVVRVDGDVPFLYLEIVPRLAPGVHIHSHDIHFPFNVPFPARHQVLEAKWPRLWTEAMLLQAFLAFNERFEIVLSASLLRYHDEETLRRWLPDYRPLTEGDSDTHYGSLWFRRRV